MYKLGKNDRCTCTGVCTPAKSSSWKSKQPAGGDGAVSRATVAEDEATHFADTGATGAHGGGRHEAKRRCTVTASMATAATSDAEAKAAQRAGTANKREAQSRDEGTESDSEARNPRGTRVQEHLPTQRKTQTQVRGGEWNAQSHEHARQGARSSTRTRQGMQRHGRGGSVGFSR